MAPNLPAAHGLVKSIAEFVNVKSLMDGGHR